MAAEKPKEPDHLKLTIPWEEAAARLFKTPAVLCATAEGEAAEGAG